MVNLLVNTIDEGVRKIMESEKRLRFISIFLGENYQFYQNHRENLSEQSLESITVH